MNGLVKSHVYCISESMTVSDCFIIVIRLPAVGQKGRNVYIYAGHVGTHCTIDLSALRANRRLGGVSADAVQHGTDRRTDTRRDQRNSCSRRNAFKLNLFMATQLIGDMSP